MRILCVIDNLGSGGAQRQLVNLAICFHRRGHDVGFLTYYPNDFYLPALQREGISCVCLNEPRALPRIWKMRRAIRSNDCDVVLSFLDTPNLIAEMAGTPWRRWRLMVGERSANPAMLTAFTPRLLRWLHLLADHVVANSRTNEEMILKLNPFLKGKTSVVYNLVDLDTYCPVAATGHPLNGVLRLVVAASHQYLKNLNGLLDALALLATAERRQIRVDWYGDVQPNQDPYRKAIAKIGALGLENTVFLYPATDQIHGKMQEADAVGLFSFYEGLPNTVCEAMACGKPVICADVSDNRHLVTEGENGFLCQPDLPASIADALRRLTANSPEKLEAMGRLSRARAERLFSQEQTAGIYLQLMKRLISPHVGRDNHSETRS